MTISMKIVQFYWAILTHYSW